jgi:hypothetical protein
VTEPLIPDEDALAVLTELVGELERFLEADDVTRQVVYRGPRGPRVVTLTLGGLLALIDRLERDAPNLLPDERQQLDEAVSTFENLRGVHAKAYHDALVRELKSQLDSWSWFVDECRRGDDACFDDYPAEAWIRTRVHELLHEADGQGYDVSAERERLAQLDDALQALFQYGDYIGPADRQDIFSRDEHWWLFGRPVPDDAY